MLIDDPKPAASPFFDVSERFKTPALMLSELVYVSRRSTTFSDDRLINMLIDAGVRNFLAGVSGRLWYSAEHFVQVLEGTSSTVDAFYARICKDPNHAGVTCIARGRIDRRAFDRPMCLFRGSDDPNVATRLGSDRSVGFDDACRATLLRAGTSAMLAG